MVSRRNTDTHADPVAHLNTDTHRNTRHRHALLYCDDEPPNDRYKAAPPLTGVYRETSGILSLWTRFLRSCGRVELAVVG